jgi:hypothetical protein
LNAKLASPQHLLQLGDVGGDAPDHLVADGGRAQEQVYLCAVTHSAVFRTVGTGRMPERVEQYRLNADKCLELAETFKDPDAKRTMFAMADAFAVPAEHHPPILAIRVRRRVHHAGAPQQLELLPYERIESVWVLHVAIFLGAIPRRRVALRGHQGNPGCRFRGRRGPGAGFPVSSRRDLPSNGSRGRS